MHPGRTTHRTLRLSGVSIALAVLFLGSCAKNDPGAATTAAPSAPAATAKVGAETIKDAPRTTAGTTSGTTAGTAAVRPAAVSYTDRTFWTGTNTVPFQIDLKTATVEDGTKKDWNLTIEATAKNYAAIDSNIALMDAPTLKVGDVAVPATIRMSGNVPGGASSKFEITAVVPTTFTFAGAALVFGNEASNQSIVPLDAGQKVTTTAPIESVIGAEEIASGTGTKVKVTKSTLWPDFRKGNKGHWFLETQVEAVYNQPTPQSVNYDEATLSLSTPDGATTGGESSTFFGPSDGLVLRAGMVSRTGARFAVVGPIEGNYALTVKLRNVKNDAGTNPVIPFVVD